MILRWLIWSWVGLTMTWSLPSIFSGVFGDWFIVEQVSSGSEDYCCYLRHQVWRVTWLKKRVLPPMNLFFIWEETPSHETPQPLLPPADFSQDLLARIGSQASACSPREAVVVSINFTLHPLGWCIAVCEPSVPSASLTLGWP